MQESAYHRVMQMQIQVPAVAAFSVSDCEIVHQTIESDWKFLLAFKGLGGGGSNSNANAQSFSLNLGGGGIGIPGLLGLGGGGGGYGGSQSQAQVKFDKKWLKLCVAENVRDVLLCIHVNKMLSRPAFQSFEKCSKQMMNKSNIS